jgi:hypothetical protein
MAQYDAKLVRGTNSLGTSEQLATETTLASIDGELTAANTELDTISGLLDDVKTNTTPASSATDTNNSVSVGSAPTTILSALAGRLRAFIYNDSDEDIYLSLGDAAVMNKGIGLPPNKCFPVPTEFKGAVYGICASGGKNATYSELS